MKKLLILPLLATLPACVAFAQNIAGDWQGTLMPGGAELRVVLHIAKEGAGFKATLDSIDQGANGIPVSSIALQEGVLKLEIAAVSGSYEGKVNADASLIQGALSQGGASLPLDFKRQVVHRVTDAAQLERKRPQNPVKPYPYSAEDLTYENKVAGIKLAATLTIPSGKGPFPAVVLITGSGPQDRDESLMGHKPFLVLSDYLTRHGIAVLRADDRGIGKSGGSFGTATTADFATDAEAGVAFLKTRSEVNPHKIGLIGHSEGGVIAPMVAARNPDVAFIVMMAGTGVSGHEILIAQRRLISEAAGDNREKLDKGDAKQQAILTLVEQEKDDAVLEKKARELLAGSVPEAQIGPQIKAIGSPWFRYFLTYDPAPALSKLKCPVLAINGEKDLQVPPKQNLPAIRKALVAGGNKDFEIDELPSLNHLFQTAKTGALTEYAEIEETIAPLALEKIATWIAAHSKL